MSGAVVTFRDITGRLRLEEHARALMREQAIRTAAEEAERRIADILESITDVFFAFDREWRVTYANSPGAGADGYPARRTGRQERLGSVAGARGHGRLRRPASSHVGARGGSPGLCLRAPARHVVPPARRAHLRGRGDYMRDVTGSRRAVEALAQSEAELSAIIQGMRDVVLVMDAEGRYLEIAPTAAPCCTGRRTS